MAELSEQFEVHPNQIADCKGRLLERAAEVFGSGAPPELVNLAPLHAKIGALALENVLFGKRAHQCGISGRKAMIDRDHELSITPPTPTSTGRCK